MASSPTEVRNRFHSTFSNDLLKGLTFCVWDGYGQADQVCREHFPREQAHDVRGDLRRAFIERNLRNFGRRIGAQARQASNSNGSSNHVVVELGGVRLTQSQARGPQDIIQHAEFREGYAESSQLGLYERPRVDNGARPLYAMLLHGPAAKPSQPAFIAVVFPTRDCRHYLYDATIDVLSMFGDVREAILLDRTEIIGDDLQLELRRRDDDDAAEIA